MVETSYQPGRPDWVPDAIFYQILPDRFCNGDPTNDPPGLEAWGNSPTRESFFGGDLQGVLGKLDYLQDLGVNALYLNPVFLARTSHRYDTSDYFQVDPALGTNELLNQLIRELHHRDMRIVLDGVFNHCGDGFWAFEDVKALGAASPYADWFTVRSYPISAAPLSYFTCGGAPYLPKLNLQYRPVQEYLLKVGTHWVGDSDVDGWRLDTACKIPRSFWRDFRVAVKTANPQAYLVGEVWRDAAPWVQGDTFDGVTNYRLRELLLDFCALGILDAEDFAYEVDTLLSSQGEAAPYMLNLLGSHDTPRILTVLHGDVTRMLIALTFLMTAVGAPLIYYGDEIGLWGETDPDCRRTMVWDERKWNGRIRDACRRLIGLRRAHIALRRGRLESLLAFDKVYVYRRVASGDEVIVVLNPGSEVKELEVATRSTAPLWLDPVAEARHAATNGILRLASIPPQSSTVLVVSDADK
ncbi:MAG: glycoside hydrolase family 13 protein [Chloroflexi bacterium]|nr:glycoside hydrolase family 13 protein [Chloroflexota bacterium]